MTSAALTQFLIDVTRGQRSREFAEDPGAVIEASGLSDGFRAALRDHDLLSLATWGAHPMALLYYARKIGWDNDRYYRCIGATDRTASTTAQGKPVDR